MLLPTADDKPFAVWARLASPDAGNGRGYFFRPEPGDEVVVGFFNNDPRQPIILGALFGSKNAPPKDVSQLTDKNVHKAIVTKKGTTIGFIDEDKPSVYIQTPGKNKITIDDKDKAVKIEDQHGNSITLNKHGIAIKSAKDLKFEASGNVEIKGARSTSSDGPDRPGGVLADARLGIEGDDRRGQPDLGRPGEPAVRQGLRPRRQDPGAGRPADPRRPARRAWRRGRPALRPSR